jgi:hypothetical protein
MAPGVMTETPIPLPRTSSRKLSAKPRRPNFVAAYNDALGVEANPEIEEMKTKCPLPRSCQRGSNSRVIRTGASRLTRRARPISSWLKLSNRPDAGNAAVGDEYIDIACLLDQRQRPAVVGEVRDKRRVPAAGERSGELHQLLGLSRAEDESGSARGERGGDRPSQPARRAGEKGGSVIDEVDGQPKITDACRGWRISQYDL